MCTHPVLPGSSTWRQVAPSSSESITALSSWLPTHFSPGVDRQRKIGMSHRPVESTTGGWRTKTPPASLGGNRVSTGPQVSPLSVEIRRRTSAVSWLPACWAV